MVEEKGEEGEEGEKVGEDGEGDLLMLLEEVYSLLFWPYHFLLPPA